MRSFLAIWIFAALITACTPCDESECMNGTCEEARCLCDSGWVGMQCELQARPEAILIKGIRIQNLPVEIFGNRKWDEDTSSADAYLPDVMLQTRVGLESKPRYSSNERYFNSSDTSFYFKQNLELSGEEFNFYYPELRFTLADLDSLAPEAMYAITASGYYTPLNGFSEIFRFRDEEGVKVTIELEYRH